MLSSILLLAHAATASVGGASSASPSAIHAAAQDVDPFDAAYDGYTDAIQAKKYAEAVTFAEKIEGFADDDQRRAIAKALRAAALYGAKKVGDASAMMKSIGSVATAGDKTYLTLFLMTMLADRMDVAGATLDRLIAEAPATVRDMPDNMIQYFFRQEPKDAKVANEDRRIALAQINYGANRPEGDYLTDGAIRLLLKRGRSADAIALLPRLDDPQAIEGMLIERRFAALWPQLEKQAGKQLETVRASSARKAQLRYGDKPDDFERIAEVANAFRHAGRLDEAIALRAKLPTTTEGWSAADEQAGWAANNIALALKEAGRADDADKLFAALNDAPSEDPSWRVSMIINRLELLIQDGKYDRANQLVEAAEKAAATHGTPYAQQLVRRIRYCTVSKLGQVSDAAKAKNDLIAHAKDALGPTVDGLICGGEHAEAEKLILTSLGDDDFATFFVRAMQAKPLTSDDPSVWNEGWSVLRARPAMASAFDRLGRDMPEAYLVPPAPGWAK